MLRAKDGSLHRDWRLLMQGSAMGLVAAITLLATAIRGLAEPPATENDGSIRVAKATDAKPRPPVAAANEAAEAAFFKRAPFDITKFAFDKHGGFLMRLGEILQQPRFAKAAREHDEGVAAFWKKTFPGAAAPPCSLQDIEYIAGDVFSAWGRHHMPPDEANPHFHEIIFGCSYAFIRWQKPVDEIWAWLKRTPGAEEKQHGDVSYVVLPTGQKVCICRVDDQTLLWNDREAHFTKRLDQFLAAPEPTAWHGAWKEVEGGLFTAIAAEAKYTVPPENVSDEPDKITREFFAKTRLLAIGMDWQPQEHGNTAFKLQARFDNEADARSLEALRRAFEKEKFLATAIIALLEQARIETRQTEKGWQIDVQLNGPIDVESQF